MQSLITIFHYVRDPRDVNARHSLASMLFLALAAMLCGARSCVEIADFAEANADELGEIVDLPHGTPSHDCFSRTFRLLDPGELAVAFGRFAAALREGLGLGAAKGVVAIDGKRLKHGYERGKAHMPPLLVSVWDAETRLSIGVGAAPPGAHPGNEVAATLAALKGLVLKGCIVTADALHAHPAMAEAVRASKADYALKVKANNAPLHDAAIAAFAAADAAAGEIAFHETSERGHDRSEWRRASVVAPLAGATFFPGLVAFGRVESRRVDVAGKASEETHHIALSRRLTPPCGRLVSSLPRTTPALRPDMWPWSHRGHARTGFF